MCVAGAKGERYLPAAHRASKKKGEEGGRKQEDEAGRSETAATERVACTKEDA